MSEAPRQTKGLVVGRMLGARVVIQPSTVLMLVVLALIFSSSSEGGITQRAFSLGVVLAVLLFVSVFLHEVAHAIAARAFHRDVSEIVLTLWGGHTSFDARGMTPAISGVTAIAGPLANVALALAGWGLQTTGVLTGTADGVLTWVIYANVLLAIFNALPGIPMDGGRVLESIVWALTQDRYRATLIAAWAGRIIAVGMVLYVILTPVARGDRPDLVQVVWAILIFSILWPAASSAINVTTAMRKREGTSAGGLMARAVGVPYSVSVAEARDLASAVDATEVVVLAADGEPAGRFPVSLTDEVPQALRVTTNLQAVTIPLARGATVPASIAGDALVAALRQWWGRADAWVVLESGEVVGVLELEIALKALR